MMPKKEASAPTSQGLGKMVLGTTFWSSLFVIATCSVGVWLVNVYLMGEITQLREELQKMSKKLQRAEGKLETFPSLQIRLEKAMTSVSAAENELAKLRDEVAKPSKKVYWNQLPKNVTDELLAMNTQMATTNKLGSRLTSLDISLGGLSSKVHILDEKLNELQLNVANMEKCFPCPCDFDRVVDSCYYIQRTSESLDADAAEKLCAAKNSTLVSIESKGEFDALRDMLIRIFNSRRYNIKHGWLTSGRRVDGVLTWTSTGDAIDENQVVWGEGEPSDEECVTFFPLLGRDMNLADISCGEIERQFICEL